MLIFLDVDGVLNGHQWMGDAQSNDIDGACILRFNRIIRETDAAIVLSSAWRYMVHGGAMTLSGFAYMLRTHGMLADAKIVGLTEPDRGIGDLDERGRQISAWLSVREATRPSATPTRYVVLDNEDLGISKAGHPFVQTDGSLGLTDADVDRAIAILKGEEHRP